MDTPIECLQKQIKVLESFKYKILSEKTSLILIGQKTELEIDERILKVDTSIAEFESAIKTIS